VSLHLQEGARRRSKGKAWCRGEWSRTKASKKPGGGPKQRTKNLMGGQKFYWPVGRETVKKSTVGKKRIPWSAIKPKIL